MAIHHSFFCLSPYIRSGSSGAAVLSRTNQVPLTWSLCLALAHSLYMQQKYYMPVRKSPTKSNMTSLTNAYKCPHMIRLHPTDVMGVDV